MAMEEGAFQNLVLMFLNDIHASNKEILKFQARQLAYLEAIKDTLYAKNIDLANAQIEEIFTAYQKMIETNVQLSKDLYDKEMIMPGFAQQ